MAAYCYKAGRNFNVGPWLLCRAQSKSHLSPALSLWVMCVCVCISTISLCVPLSPLTSSTFSPLQFFNPSIKTPWLSPVGFRICFSFRFQSGRFKAADSLQSDLIAGLFLLNCTEGSSAFWQQHLHNLSEEECCIWHSYSGHECSFGGVTAPESWDVEHW